MHQVENRGQARGSIADCRFSDCKRHTRDHFPRSLSHLDTAVREPGQGLVDLALRFAGTCGPSSTIHERSYDLTHVQYASSRTDHTLERAAVRTSSGTVTPALRFAGTCGPSSTIHERSYDLTHVQYASSRTDHTSVWCKQVI